MQKKNSSRNFAKNCPYAQLLYIMTPDSLRDKRPLGVQKEQFQQRYAVIDEPAGFGGHQQEYGGGPEHDFGVHKVVAQPRSSGGKKLKKWWTIGPQAAVMLNLIQNLIGISCWSKGGTKS